VINIVNTLITVNAVKGHRGCMTLKKWRMTKRHALPEKLT
jgi:hypothetical protein